MRINFNSIFFSLFFCYNYICNQFKGKVDAIQSFINLAED